MNLPLHLVGTRSTRVPNFQPERWGRGGTRPYHVQGFNARILRGILSPVEAERGDRGVEAFVRQFGCADRQERPDRLNFGGRIQRKDAKVQRRKV
ncbi:MAG: hypothetical protein MUF81_19735 [Verrucomicrobia bacterium]|jgi:hypothetical protein|nr:hypothetical protein [Verrucomicrobiota bacterium]